MSQPISEFSGLPTSDFANKVARMLSQGQRVTWHTVIQFTQDDRDPSGFVIRLFGLNRAAQVIDQLSKAQLESSKSGCDTALTNQIKLLDEISLNYVPRLIEKHPIQLGPVLNSLKTHEVLTNENLKSVVILYCLQPILTSLPMPMPISRWFRWHCIPYDPNTDSANMDMEIYISKIESKRVLYFNLFDRLFSSKRAQVSLTKAQWIDLGILSGRYSVMKNRTKLDMFKDWLKWIRIAEKSGQKFLELIFVDDLFRHGSCTSQSRESLQSFQVEVDIPPEKSFDNWEVREIFTFVFETILKVKATIYSQIYNRFEDTFLKLFYDPTVRSLGAFFIEQLEEEYKPLYEKRGHPNYNAAQKVFKELRQHLDDMMKDKDLNQVPVEWLKMYRFLHAALVTYHINYFFPMRPEDSLIWLEKTASLRYPERIDDLLNEQVIEWGDRERSPVDIGVFIRSYTFSPEQEMEIFIKYIHYFLQLRSTFLPNPKQSYGSVEETRLQRTLEFDEIIQFLDELRSFLGQHILEKYMYYLLRLQFFTVRDYETFKIFTAVRDAITAKNNLRFMPIPIQHLSEAGPAVLKLNVKQPKTWEFTEEQQQYLDTHPRASDYWKFIRMQDLASFPHYLCNLYQNATLLFRHTQEVYVRFAYSLIASCLQPPTPLDTYCMVHQGMFMELLPDNRVVKVEGGWNEKGTAFILDAFYLFSYKNPMSRHYQCVFDFPRNKITAPLIQLLSGVLPYLCNEELDEDLKYFQFQEMNGEPFVCELLKRLSQIAGPLSRDYWTSLYAEYQKLMSPENEQREENVRFCEALLRYSDQLKQLSRVKLIDLIQPVIGTPSKEPWLQAAEGEIWKGHNGLSLIPLHSCDKIDESMGIFYDRYQDCCFRLSLQMLEEASETGKIEKFCSLAVKQSTPTPGEEAVCVTWKRKLEKCLEDPVEEKVGNKIYILVTFSFLSKPEITYEAKYPNSMSQKEIQSMLLWQLLQLKSSYYRSINKSSGTHIDRKPK